MLNPDISCLPLCNGHHLILDIGWTIFKNSEIPCCTYRFNLAYAVKPVLSGHSKRRPKIGLQDRLWRMFEGFQDGCLGMRQFKQFSIFMLPWCIPPSFGSIWHMVWEESHVAWSISRWLSWLPSWISEQDNFSMLPWCIPPSFGSIRWYIVV